MSTITPKPRFKCRSMWHQRVPIDHIAESSLIPFASCSDGPGQTSKEGSSLRAAALCSYSQEENRRLRDSGENFQIQAVCMLLVILFGIEKNRTVPGNRVKNYSIQTLELPHKQSCDQMQEQAMNIRTMIWFLCLLSALHRVLSWQRWEEMS